MFLADRFLLRVYSLIVSLTVIWLGLGLLGVGSVLAYTKIALQDDRLWVYVAVLLLLSLRYLFFPLQARQVHSFVKDAEGGEIRIAYATVSELARRAASRVRGVDRLAARIEEQPSGLEVHIRVRARADVELTNLCEEVQSGVAQAIRSATSLSVAAVHVQIVGLAPESEQRRS